MSGEQSMGATVMRASSHELPEAAYSLKFLQLVPGLNGAEFLHSSTD